MDINDFVAVDLETTGFHRQYDKIVQIGAVHVKDGKVVSEFDELIYMDREIPEFLKKNLGITPMSLLSARTHKEVIPDFKNFIMKRLLVAQNAQFDHSMLKVAFRRQKIYFDNPYVCTMKLARKAYPNLPNHRLETLADFLKLSNERHHTALNDARVCADIFLIMTGREPVCSIRNTADSKTNPMLDIIKKFNPFKLN